MAFNYYPFNLISDILFQVVSRLRYILKAQGAHLLHSPFVFNLYTQVIRQEGGTIEPEKHRKELLASRRRIKRISIGAPSRVISGTDSALGDVAAVSLLPAKYSRLLYRLAEYFKAQQVLEFGTSAGITTLYLSMACPQAEVHTMEGNPEMAEVARELFVKAGSGNIHLHQGLFRECLPEVFRQLSKPDFVFLDGDHRKEAVLENLRQILPRMPESGVLIVDDIHWSRDMEEAWREIKQLPEVTVTIDLFRMGLVFLKKDQAPQHFILRF